MKYPWKRLRDTTFEGIFGGVWRVRYRVPPDTARRALARRQAVPVALSEEIGDAIEQAFWDFDAERKRTGAERDAFKGQMRKLARRDAERKAVR